MADENLWGNLSDLTVTKTPVSILREQAEVLSQSTRGTLVGSVRSINSSWGGAVAWELQVRVPAMGNYITTLITIHHPITIYPIYLFEASVAGIQEKNITNETDFKALVSKTLIAAPTR